MSEFDQENRKTARVLIQKAKALNNRQYRHLTLNAAQLGVYGWQMAVPVLLGVMLGLFLDKEVPIESVSWTLNFILIGFIIGILNANRWLTKEGIIIKKKKEKGIKK